MPTWGLTEQQREMRPWGLHPELLMPRKVTTDPVHGDIHTTVLEQAIVDTSPFQRLRRVRQLGTTHEVYPGATHTRFSHSLGALRVVQDLLDGVTSQHEGRRPVPDLVAQWREADLELAGSDIAQAVVLARLGALLHDLCHVPFGHSIEDDLRVLVPHDENGVRFGRLWKRLAADLPTRVRRHLRSAANAEAVCASLQTLLDPGGELHRELRPLIISKDDYAKRLAADGGLRYPFTADLVGNTICADLLDYLLRDHLYTGLPAAIGRRFTAAFFIVPEGRGPYSQRVALNIMQDGYERTDVVSELLKALRYRYELSERALYHHAKLAADVMIGKALDLWARAVWLEETAPVIARLDDVEDLVEALDHHGLRTAAERALAEVAEARNDQAAGQATQAASTHGTAAASQAAEGQSVAAERPAVAAAELRPIEASAAAPSSQFVWANAGADHVEAPVEDPAVLALVRDDGEPGDVIVERQQQRLEDEVLAHGDDGLLEHVAALADSTPAGGPSGPVIDDLRRQAASLGRALLDRELFAIGGRVGVDDAPAAKLYAEFGSVAQRTAAQDEAQRFAEVGRDPRLLIWLPDPEMRLKLARVLVDNGEHINEFQAYEEARGGRGDDIYRAHRRLWSLWVFCARCLSPEQREAALVYLAAKYGVAWERMRDHYGADPGTWIVRHGLSRLLHAEPLDPQVTRLIASADQVAARGPAFQTISDVVTALQEIPEVAEVTRAAG